MSKRLDDLIPTFRVKVFELLARCTEHGIYVMVIDTLRTVEEQNENIKKGVSWTKHSPHLVGRAIDLCPIKSYMGLGTTKLNWDEVNPEWGTIGALGESLGLKWGVWREDTSSKVPAWRRRGDLINIDLGHFEYKAKLQNNDTP